MHLFIYGHLQSLAQEEVHDRVCVCDCVSNLSAENRQHSILCAVALLLSVKPVYGRVFFHPFLNTFLCVRDEYVCQFFSIFNQSFIAQCSVPNEYFLFITQTYTHSHSHNTGHDVSIAAISEMHEWKSWLSYYLLQYATIV